MRNPAALLVGVLLSITFPLPVAGQDIGCSGERYESEGTIGWYIEGDFVIEVSKFNIEEQTVTHKFWNFERRVIEKEEIGPTWSDA